MNKPEKKHDTGLRILEVLKILLETEENEDIKEYIQSLLVPTDYKRLSDDGFKQKKLGLKMPYNKYSKITNANK